MNYGWGDRQTHTQTHTELATPGLLIIPIILTSSANIFTQYKGYINSNQTLCSNQISIGLKL